MNNQQEAVPSANPTTNKAKKPRLGFILSSKFKKKSKNRSGAISSLGLMEGNSTNTVNTVEDTEDSTNANDKIKVTTFTSHDEVSVTASFEVFLNLKTKIKKRV